MHRITNLILGLLLLATPTFADSYSEDDTSFAGFAIGDENAEPDTDEDAVPPLPEETPEEGPNPVLECRIDADQDYRDCLQSDTPRVQCEIERRTAEELDCPCLAEPGRRNKSLPCDKPCTRKVAECLIEGEEIICRNLSPLECDREMDRIQIQCEEWVRRTYPVCKVQLLMEKEPEKVEEIA